MADVLGRGGERPAVACRAEAESLAYYVNAHMWDEGRGLYADRRLRGGAEGSAGALSRSGSIAAYWPLLAGLVPPPRVPRLVAHLDDPAAFNRGVRPPALSARDPGYQPRGGYWNVSRQQQRGSYRRGGGVCTAPRASPSLRLRLLLQGGVWPPTTYMVLRGLSLAGQDDVAADIGANYHAAVTQVCRF